MSETEGTSREEENRLNWLWAVGALVCVAGFLSWLALTTERTQVQVVEAPEEEQSGEVALTVPVDSFVATVDRYVDTGTRVRLSRIPVASRVGTQMFWTQLPGEQPGFSATYLIALDSAMVSDSVAVQQGQNVTITGNVTTMTDSLLNQWVSNGTITEDQRLEVSFATTFMRVDDIVFPDAGTEGTE